ILWIHRGIEEPHVVDVVPFRPGDHLVVSCQPHRAEVVGADKVYVYVQWPWRRPDPESVFRWDGTRAFARDPLHHDFDWLWRLDPPPAELQTGDLCVVLIPPTEVVVTWATHFDPPKDMGSLPRPTGALTVVPASAQRHRGDEDEEQLGQGLYLNKGEPLEIE